MEERGVAANRRYGQFYTSWGSRLIAAEVFVECVRTGDGPPGPQSTRGMWPAARCVPGGGPWGVAATRRWSRSCQNCGLK
eukprot:5617647-Pyramimonas_sp.AAC.1